MANLNENKNIEIKINVPEHLKTGVYANFISVNATSNGELIMDLIFAHPTDKSYTLVSRVIIPLKVGQDFNMILQKLLGKTQQAD